MSETSRKNTKVQKITDKERLIFLFKTLSKEGKRLPSEGNALMVPISKLNIKPFFDDDIYPGFSEQAFGELLLSVQADKDFYTKHNMTDYHPSFNFDYARYLSDQDVVLFHDFTDDFLNEYLEDRLGVKSGNGVILQRTNKKKLHLPDLPTDLRWGEIVIRFLNGDEVQITARDLVYQTNYELMGFKDQKTKNPTFQWNLLKVFSLKNGYLHWDNNKDLDTKNRNRVGKQKQELSNKLKLYFHTITDDPFFNYKKEKGHRIKIQLIPEQSGDINSTANTIVRNIDNTKENDTEIQDFFNEQISDSDN